MDLSEEVQKQLNKNPSLDEDTVDILKAAAYFISVAVVKNAKAKPRESESQGRKNREESVGEIMSLG